MAARCTTTSTSPGTASASEAGLSSEASRTSTSVSSTNRERSGQVTSRGGGTRHDARHQDGRTGTWREGGVVARGADKPNHLADAIQLHEAPKQVGSDKARAARDQHHQPFASSSRFFHASHKKKDNPFLGLLLLFLFFSLLRSATR